MKSRTKNSMRNLIVAYAMQCASILVTFICRTAFAKLLTEEYLGISGLFTNIVSVLSLSELGIGSVIIIHLYGPIARNDEFKIVQLMTFYRRAYTLIGFFVLGCGIALSPFIHMLVKGEQSIPYLKLYFILFVIQSASSYFFAYKRSLLIASQKEYICVLVSQAFDFLMKLTQIVVLFISHQYFLYLIVSILTNIGANIVLSCITNRLYPYLKNQTASLSNTEIKSMMKDVSSMMLHKVGNTVVASTDNIIISVMIGIVYTGKYSNYLLLMNLVSQVITTLINSLSASLGDYNAQKNYEERKQMFDSLCFFTQWIYGFGFIGFVCLFQPFIEIWLGEGFLLDFSVVLIISLNFYLNGISRIPSIFVDLNGLFNKTKWKPIAVAIINFVVSLISVKYMGLIGVFVGTLVSYLFVSIWVDPFYLYKYVWRKSIMSYAISHCCSFAVTLLVCAATFFSISHITSFVLKIVICLTLPNVCYLLLFFKREEFRFLYSRISFVFAKRRTNPTLDSDQIDKNKIR